MHNMEINHDQFTKRYALKPNDLSFLHLSFCFLLVRFESLSPHSPPISPNLPSLSGPPLLRGTLLKRSPPPPPPPTHTQRNFPVNSYSAETLL